MTRTFLSPAKLNIFLNIIGKRPDGFHELETLMVPLKMGDQLHVTPAEGTAVTLSCNVEGVPCDESNLVAKAVSIVREHCGLPARGLRVHIEKTTPMGGGMGGGSSNGATMLKALNELWSLNLSVEDLEGLAAKLGSDCAFFIRNTPAICLGRGEIIQPVELRRGLDFVVVNPGFGISTKWAYETLALMGYAPAPPLANLLRCINEENLAGLQQHLFNSLEAPAFNKHLILPEIRKHLVEFGSTASMMSGSGATVFSICDSAAQALSVAEKLKAHYGPHLFCLTTGLA